MPPTQVLDKGEIELVASCADDLAVVNAARVSVNKHSDQLTVADEGLISFLMRERHGSPFEHTYFRFRVKAPLFVFREWHRHRTGHCLPGSAQVVMANGGVKRSLVDLFKLKHEGVTDTKGRTRILPSCQHPNLRVLNDQGEFVEGAAADIYSSGMKDVFEVVHERGVLRATADHKIYTEEGWKKVCELEKGDRVGIQGRVWRPEERSVPPSLRAGIGVWTSMQRRHKILPRDLCYICGNIFNRDELELDHVVPVSENLLLALDPENLSPVCVSCHSKKTFTKEQPSRVGTGRLGVVPSILKAVPLAVSHEMTYDIEMAGPHHNFVADNVVIHNSYNEWSARYSQLEPDFYCPAQEEVVTQEGKPGAYTFVKADPIVATGFQVELLSASSDAYANYEWALKQGIAKQQARLFLPVNIYSEMYWSCNARSLMHFLGLRNSSNAQAEIRQYAQAAEDIFKSVMPVTYAAFIEGGRTTP